MQINLNRPHYGGVAEVNSSLSGLGAMSGADKGNGGLRWQANRVARYMFAPRQVRNYSRALRVKGRYTAVRIEPRMIRAQRIRRWLRLIPLFFSPPSA